MNFWITLYYYEQIRSRLVSELSELSEMDSNASYIAKYTKDELKVRFINETKQFEEKLQLLGENISNNKNQLENIEKKSKQSEEQITQKVKAFKFLLPIILFFIRLMWKCQITQKFAKFLPTFF